jgi:hypothetical protein
MESKHQGENAEHMLAAIAAALAAHQSPRTLQRQAVQHFAALNEWQIDKYDFSLKKLGQRQPPTARADVACLVCALRPIREPSFHRGLTMRRRRPPPIEVFDDDEFIRVMELSLHPLNWRGVALFCSANRHYLRDEREINFVSNMLTQTAAGKPLTWRQQRWLRDIRERLLRVAEDR